MHLKPKSKKPRNKQVPLPKAERTIPEDKLKATIEFLRSDQKLKLINISTSCKSGIHNSTEDRTAISHKLKYARMCLIRRDWRNLAKVLSQSNHNGNRSRNVLYQLFARYGIICLAHNNSTAIMDSFSKSVLSLGNINLVIKKCAEYPQSNEMQIK